MLRSDRETHATRDLARAWERAVDHVGEPERRLRAVLALAETLAGAERAIVFDDAAIVAAAPGTAGSAGMRRLFQRARRVLEDEHVGPDLYVARIAPGRVERLALRWRAPHDGSVAIARAILASCAWALDRRTVEAAPADLPDGTLTVQRIEQLVHDARRMKRSFAVVYVDAELPIPSAAASREAVARRLRAEVRANDHLGHLGGDAYLALVSLQSSEAEAHPAAQRLLRAAAAGAAPAAANVGIAICPADGEQADDLVEKAGAAALAAASGGGSGPCWYREAAGRAHGERAAVRSHLRDGDPGALFELLFQPIVDARSGEPYAAAALATWRSEAAGRLAPAEFLAGEPDGGARRALERWTIASAAEAYRAWRAAGVTWQLHLSLGPPDEAMLETVVERFGAGEALRGLMLEVIPDESLPARALESFARRLRAHGAHVGVAAGRTAQARFDLSSGLLDFVSVDASAGDVRALAELALATVLAPTVLARGAADRERARWLARYGATALAGEGLAAPMGLQQLVWWAREQRGSAGL